MHAHTETVRGSELQRLLRGQQPGANASTHRKRWSRIGELVGVMTVYVVLARLGQITAIAPGNITPIYPAAGFAIACVLLRGPRVWPGIWLGHLLGNAWAFVNFSNVGVAVTTCTAGAFASCGAVFQTLAAAYLIRRSCGNSNPFNELRQLYSFGAIVVITCLISPSMGVTGLSLSGILAWEDYGSSFSTWYLGDLMGAVLWVPLMITFPLLVGHIRETHRSLETGVVLSLVLVFSLCVLYSYVPLQTAGNTLLLFTLPLVLWAAFRLAQPGVAMLVNMIGPLAAYLTTQGVGPFLTNDSHLSLELLQLFMMVTMIAGLSLAIAIKQLRDSRASYRKLRLAIDRASDAVFLIRPDGSFEYANAHAATLLGYPTKALMSMGVFVYDVDSNFSASTWPEFWRDVLRQEGLHFESVVQRKDDSEVPVEISINRLAIDDTELACAIVKDISMRKRAEDSTKRLEQILNSTSAVIYEKDTQGRYVFANKCWAHLFDIDPNTIRGKTDYDLFPWEMAEAFCRNDRRVIDSGQSLQTEEVAPHADGPHTYVSVKVPVWDAKGRVSGVAGISTDISEQLAAKEELKNSERLAAIGKMINCLAHECRNALQRSQACLSMLIREIRADSKATDYANRVQHAQDHLQHVFEELRSYASPLHLERRECNLSALIHEAWEEVTSVSETSDVRLRIVESELDLTCDVDPFRIQQVFRNIFENAISASSAPGSITVEWCHVNLATRPALRTTVCDAGSGFTPEQRTQAFQPFFTTKVTGTGLGLTITRRIVESHGGQIEIDGDSSTGGIIVITLPRRRE